MPPQRQRHGKPAAAVAAVSALGLVYSCAALTASWPQGDQQAAAFDHSAECAAEGGGVTASSSGHSLLQNGLVRNERMAHPFDEVAAADYSADSSARGDGLASAAFFDQSLLQNGVVRTERDTDVFFEAAQSETPSPTHSQAHASADKPGASAGKPGQHQEDGHAESHSHDHLALVFFFGVLLIGSLILLFVERCLEEVLPYTCALFLAGMLASLAHHYNVQGSWVHWEPWYRSIDMWQEIDPHMLFFAFLPALLFGEAMSMNVQLALHCLPQVLILACPGVILGTWMTAKFAMVAFPYGWDWNTSLVFGSILSATDPVAVVALFHTLGVSPRLTMLVSGESLLNDGTAIVVFTLVFKLVLGVPFEIWSSVGFFCHMTFSALALGVLVGLAAVGLIGLCSEGEQTSDAILQVTISICCGYVAFLIGELQVKTSGVISTVCAGFVFALFAWPRFISRETIRTVWETIEFIANTIIFFLAGVLFANTILERWGLVGLSDVWWCLALWFALTAIRVLTVVFLWWPLNKVGNPITLNDAIVMVWSGMRGAVSLCLAIIVDMEPRISKEMGSRIMFHVGGVATLTILVNATTAPAILRALGITKSSHVKERMLSCFAKTLAHQAATEFKQESQIEEDVRFRGANESIVREMMRPPSGVEVVPEDVGGFTDVSEKALLMIYREMHLKVVQTQYWEAIDAGILPRNLYAARILLQSVDKALDDTSTGLTDWAPVMRGLQAEDVEEPGRLVRFLGGLAESRPFAWSTTFRRWFAKDFRAKRAVLVILSFQEAHLNAQMQVPKYLDMEDAFDVKVHQQIRQESALECEQAADFLRRLPAQDVEMAKSEMLARKLLTSQIKHINEMEEKGVLSSFEAGHLQAHCLASLRKLGSSTKATWLEAVEK